MLVNKKIISTIQMGGRGGGEAVFAPALEGFQRISECLYDFVNEDTEEKVELKKQKNLQWFDGWKYHNLSAADKKNIMLFVLHDGKNVSQVYSISLGQMIETLLADPDYDAAGWNPQVLENLYNLKKVSPKLQSKLPLKVKNFVQKYNNLFIEHYSV